MIDPLDLLWNVWLFGAILVAVIHVHIVYIFGDTETPFWIVLLLCAGSWWTLYKMVE